METIKEVSSEDITTIEDKTPEFFQVNNRVNYDSESFSQTRTAIEIEQETKKQAYLNSLKLERKFQNSNFKKDSF